MKAALFLLFCICISATTASCGKFGHASCALTWTINATCNVVFQSLKGNIQNCCAQKSIDKAYTNYTLVSADQGSLTLQSNLHFSDGYVDDQTIQLSSSGGICVASVCSFSESLSVYDYCANYCDGHNLIRGLGFQFEEKIGTCSYVPNNSAKCPVFGASTNSEDPKDIYCDKQ